MRGGKEEHSTGAEAPWGRGITAWGAEKAQQCHKYFLQYCTFVINTTAKANDTTDILQTFR